MIHLYNYNGDYKPHYVYSMVDIVGEFTCYGIPSIFMAFSWPKGFVVHFFRLDPTEAEEAQCDALISLSVDGSRSMATTDSWGIGRCALQPLYLGIFISHYKL
jgi:hypothetical protein